MRKLRRLLSQVAVVASAYFAPVAFAAPTPEDYGKLPELSSMVVSPNGELIAYRNTKSDAEDFIVVYSLKQKKHVNSFRVDEIDPRYLSFSGNDHLLLVVSEHVDLRRFKNSFDVSTVYAYDIKQNKVRPLVKLGEALTGRRVVYPGQSIGDIVGTTSVGRNVIVGAFVGDTDTDQSPRYSLLKINISGKGRPQLASSGNPYVSRYFLDREQQPLARIERNERNDTHSVRVRSGGSWKEIYEYESELTTHNFLGLTPDFKSLVFLRNDENDLRYYTLALSDGDIGLLQGADVEKSTTRMLNNDQQVLVGVEYAGLKPSYRMFDAKVDQRVQQIVSSFGDNSVHLSSWSPDFKHLLVRVEGSQYAGEYVLFSEGQKPRSVGSARPNIKSKDINTLATFEIPARDGLMLPTILTLPNSRIDNLQNMPTVLLPHGGPAAQDQVGFDYMAQALARRGYLVVQPQFRGSTGFTKQLLEAGYGEWGRKMQDDLTDTVNYLVKEGLSDPARVCIAGASYGGYAALAGAAFTPDLYACALSIAGVSHLPRLLKEDKSRYGKESDVLLYLKRSILNSETNPRVLEEISPYFAAHQVKIPVLLLHGADDTRVDFEQSKMMHRALRKAGKDAELIRLKNEDHHLSEGSTRLQAIQAMVGFIDKHIGD